MVCKIYVKSDSNPCAFSHFTLYADLAVMLSYGVLYNGKPQSRSSYFLGMTFVHTVKSLENAILMLRRNADSVIFHHKYRFVAFFFHLYPHMTVFMIVFNGIVTEVIKNPAKLLADAQNTDLFSGKRQRDMCAFCSLRKAVCGFLRQCLKVYLFLLFGNIPLIQMGQTDNIIHKAYHTLGFRIDLF